MKNNLESTTIATFALLFSSIILLPVHGQPFDVGNKNLNMTIGMGTPWVLYNDYKTVLPPVTASFDYGIRDDIGPGILSIGGVMAATTYKDSKTTPDDYGYKSTTLIMALRSTYHYQLVNKLDTYGGIHLGMRMEMWKEYGDFPPAYETMDDLRLRPMMSLFGGAKYYFTDNIAAMLELGFSIAFINAGICIKL